MGVPKDRAANNGPDWLDITEALDYVQRSYEVSVTFSIETYVTAEGVGLLCITTAVPLTTNILPRSAVGTYGEAGPRDLSRMLAVVHDTILQLTASLDTFQRARLDYTR